MEVELAWMGFLNGTVEGQLLFKEASAKLDDQDGERL